jgi:phage-related protein
MTEELKIVISAEIGKMKAEIDKGKKEINKFKSEVEKASKHNDENWQKVGDKIGSAISTGCKVAAGAIASVSAGIAAMTKSAIGNFAEYEQLVGGVDTLFKESSGKVQQYAANAFKTAGMSANEYMSTVTGFSASLLQSLGGDTAKAAEVAHMALTDMSDNANKMGSSMESIQNAYGGFAKQNYTMLDNLKLGYGGTQEEMERLLKDAQKFSGVKYNIKNLNDVYKAIHVIQNEMGITGTTAKEASETISGSWASTQAAWTNLMTGLANGNANIPQLVADVVASAGDVLKNVIPAIKEIIKNIPVAISEISPEAGAAFQVVSDAIMEVLPVIKEALQTTFDLIVDAINFVSENTGVITAAGVAIGIVTTAIGLYNAVAAVKAAMAAAEVTTVWALVSAYAAQAAAMIIAIAPYLLIAAAIAAVIAIIVLCVKHWDEIKAKVAEVWDSMKNKITEKVNQIKAFVQAGIQLVKSYIVDPIVNAKNKVVEAFSNIKDKAVEKIEALKNKVKSIVDTIKGFFDFEFKTPKIKTPKFGITPSGWKVGDLLEGVIPKLSIKWNAEGGVFTKPTLTTYNGTLQGLGEAGAEAIVPLEKNTEWLDKIADKLVARQSNKPVILNVDGKEFARTSINTINDYTKQTGSLALNII